MPPVNLPHDVNKTASGATSEIFRIMGIAPRDSPINYSAIKNVIGGYMLRIKPRIRVKAVSVRRNV